jgi:hypothetical protein
MAASYTVRRRIAIWLDRGRDMTENKTKQSEISASSFIEAVPDARQRTDALTLSAMMGDPPRMWGPSIIGFGSYHYKYDSGREGDTCRIGFSPRKGQTVLYLVDGFSAHGRLLAQLGKHKKGKSCLYIKRLSDVDLAILEQLISASLVYMDEHYPR